MNTIIFVSYRALGSDYAHSLVCQVVPSFLHLFLLILGGFFSLFLDSIILLLVIVYAKSTFWIIFCFPSVSLDACSLSLWTSHVSFFNYPCWARKGSSWGWCWIYSVGPKCASFIFDITFSASCVSYTFWFAKSYQTTHESSTSVFSKAFSRVGSSMTFNLSRPFRSAWDSIPPNILLLYVKLSVGFFV